MKTSLTMACVAQKKVLTHAELVHFMYGFM